MCIVYPIRPMQTIGNLSVSTLLDRCKRKPIVHTLSDRCKQSLVGTLLLRTVCRRLFSRDLPQNQFCTNIFEREFLFKFVEENNKIFWTSATSFLYSYTCFYPIKKVLSFDDPFCDSISRFNCHFGPFITRLLMALRWYRRLVLRWINEFRLVLNSLHLIPLSIRCYGFGFK